MKDRSRNGSRHLDFWWKFSHHVRTIRPRMEVVFSQFYKGSSRREKKNNRDMISSLCSSSVASCSIRIISGYQNAYSRWQRVFISFVKFFYFFLEYHSVLCFFLNLFSKKNNSYRRNIYCSINISYFFKKCEK